MGQVSQTNSYSVGKEAAHVAFWAALLAGLLFFVDSKTGFAKQLDLVPEDIVMIGCSAIVFCLLWVLLAKWFFQPFVKLVEAREKLTVGAAEQLLEKQNIADELVEKYDLQVTEARVAAMKNKLAALSQAKLEGAQIIEKAHAEGQAMIKEARNQLNNSRKEMENQSGKEAEQLASALV